MSFLIEQLRQLGMVAVVMVCSLGGTVGIIKLIKHFLPGKDFPKDPNLCITPIFAEPIMISASDMAPL